jgi:hypothetical protein
MFTGIMPTENKSNKIITIVLAVIITLAAITVIYISLPQNKENEKTTDENNEQQDGNNQTEESAILTVIYGDEQTNYTLEELEALDSYTGMGGYRTSKPSIKGQGNYTGVPVTTLIGLAAGDIENYSIIVTSDDGEIIENTTYNYSFVRGNVDFYNSSDSSNATPIGNGGLTMVLAYKYEGNHLDESEDGKLKIVFLNENEELITSSGIWWKYVISIEIVEQ